MYLKETFTDFNIAYFSSIDATEEPVSGPLLGRLVNHGEKREINVKLAIIDNCGLPALCLFALRNLKEGEELLYHYGINNVPWKTKHLKVIMIKV